MENRRVFARLEDGPKDGGPDGANVDRDGFYWCAVFAGGEIRRYDPAGKLERRLKTPVLYPTMPAFGGKIGARCSSPRPRGRSRMTNAASIRTKALMAMEAPAPGLPEPYAAG
jgi:sugar lactone lactonase YvrE